MAGARRGPTGPRGTRTTIGFAMPSSRLLPPLAPLPRPLPWKEAGGVLAALLVSAGLLLVPRVGPGAFPGDPALPFAPVTLNLHWQVHTRGILGYLADDLHNLPYRTDRSVVDGLPLDALASAPFSAALGFENGMWAYALALLWAVGAAGAWLGGRWWGSWGAALVTGVAWQTAEVVLRELGDGRSTQVFAALFLPLCLGLGALAADAGASATPAGRPRPAVAVAAGLSVALATLSSWDFAILALPLALGPALLRRDWAVAATILASAGAIVLPAVGWVWSGIAELPSATTDPWRTAALGGGMVRPADLAAARIYGVDGVALRTLGRPLLVALGAWGVWRAGAGALRGMWWPAAVAGMGIVLGLGHWLPGPVVLPWGFTSLTKGAMRFWWADRAWLLPALTLALLAGGVLASVPRGRGPTTGRGPLSALPPSVLAVLAAGLLVAEATLLSPALPFGAISLAPSTEARALATSDAPLLLLPLGGGPLRADRLDLVDQVSHGRPMSGGTRYPFDVTAPLGLERGWRENPTLRAIGACEGHPVAASAPAPVGDPLVRAGLREVWLDERYLDGAPGAAYRACVTAALDGWTVDAPAGFARYRAPVTAEDG